MYAIESRTPKDKLIEQCWEASLGALESQTYIP